MGKENQENNGDSQYRIRYYEREAIGRLAVDDVFVSEDSGIVYGRNKPGETGIVEVGVYQSFFDRHGFNDEGCIQDDTRLRAKYVVEAIVPRRQQIQEIGPMGAPSHEHTVNEIHARRLSPDGKYNSQGELIVFFDGGDYIGALRQIKILGKRVAQ